MSDVSGLAGAWWISTPDDPELLAGGEFTFGHAGDGPEPDWAYADEFDNDGEGPVRFLAERFRTAEPHGSHLWVRDTRTRLVKPSTMLCTRCHGEGYDPEAKAMRYPMLGEPYLDHAECERCEGNCLEPDDD